MVGDFIIGLKWSFLPNRNIYRYTVSSNGFWASLVAESVKNPPAMQKTWGRSQVLEDPLEKEQLPTPVFCLENSIDRGVWQAPGHGVAKS